MSVKNAVKFLEEVYQDEAKQKDLVNSTTADEVIAYATDAGYDFTIEELEEGQEQFYDTHDIELDEEELEAAAGGVVVATFVKAS